MKAELAGCVCVDGQMFAPEQAMVSALDAGFLLGDGLFESLRATDGMPYLLDRHLERLYAVAREVGYAELPTPDALAELIDATLARASLQEAYLRITVTRGRMLQALARPQGPPTIVIAALPVPSRGSVAEAVDVALLQSPTARGSSAKSTSRQSAVLALRAVEPAGCREAVYVRDGRVLEGISSNVFAVCGGCLLTPPVEDCLPGITRGRVLELAAKSGLPLAETVLTVAQLLDCQELFITNAVQGLRAVRTVDGRPIAAPDDRPNGVFEALLDLYEADRLAAIRGAAER